MYIDECLAPTLFSECEGKYEEETNVAHVEDGKRPLEKA